MGLAPPGEKGEIMLFNYTIHGEEVQLIAPHLHESKAATRPGASMTWSYKKHLRRLPILLLRFRPLPSQPKSPRAFHPFVKGLFA